MIIKYGRTRHYLPNKKFKKHFYNYENQIIHVRKCTETTASRLDDKCIFFIKF